MPQDARTLGFLLREAYASMQEGVYAAVAASGHPGVRPAHSVILRHLPAQGGRVADIARAAGMAKQSVSYVVDDLVGLGYLRTQPDPDDRRAKRVSFTARGRKLVADLVDASRESEAALGLALGSVRLREFRRMLEAVPTVDLRGSRTIP
jgi:DNA-binding MarR family transcriptional regulator